MSLLSALEGMTQNSGSARRPRLLNRVLGVDLTGRNAPVSKKPDPRAQFLAWLGEFPLGPGCDTVWLDGAAVLAGWRQLAEW